MAQKNGANKILLAVAAAATTFYVYDVQYNHGKTIEPLGLPNWNPAPITLDTSYVNQGLQKVEDIKSSSTNWISEKAQKGQNVVGDIGNTVSDKVNSLIGNTKDYAERAYANADYSYKEAEKNYNQYKKSWFSWGKDKNEEARAAAKAKLDEAKKQLDDSRSSLAKWGDSAVKDADGRINELLASAQKNAGEFVDGLKKDASDLKKDATNQYQNAKADAADKYEDAKADASKKYGKIRDTLNQRLSEDEFVKTASNSVRGWGDSASELAKDEYDALFDKNGKLTLASQDSAERVAQYYNEKAAEAKKRYDETQSSWLKWRKAQSKELQDSAREQYDYILSRKKEADSALQNVLEQAAGHSQNVIGKVQEGLHNANEVAQKNLDKASSYISEKKPKN